MSLEDTSPSDVALNRKRLHVDMESMPDGPDTGVFGPEVDEELQEPFPDGSLPPPTKRPKAGRKPLPDEPCEHGPSVKTCQKCIYRNRVDRVCPLRFLCLLLSLMLPYSVSASYLRLSHTDIVR